MTNYIEYGDKNVNAFLLIFIVNYIVFTIMRTLLRHVNVEKIN